MPVTLDACRPEQRITWDAEPLSIPYPMPRKFTRIPTFQWKEIPGKETPCRRHQQLLLWVALTRMWVACYSIVTCYPHDMQAALEELHRLEVEEDVPPPELLSDWNPEQWDYLPCRYPFAVRHLFEEARLELKPRFPWVEKTGVYRHDKIS